ncbi:hypothetical protein ACQ143_00380 [Microbacterium sp. MC2]
MNLNKQFINLVGSVVILAVVVAGIALIAVPMWSQSQATDASTRTVAQTNAVYQAQIDQLTAAETRLDEIDAHLVELRTEIAPFTRLDDAFDLIVTAAEERDLVLESVTAGEPEPFVPRTAVTDDAGQATPPASTEESTAPADADPSAGAPAAEAAPEPTSPDATSPQQQVAFTIAVPVPDAEAAAAFVDDLRAGPRLISVIDATLSDGVLTVTALTYIRTED